MTINFLIFPYRDRFFLHRYGFAVRDLQIIAALSQSPDVGRIVVFDRPVTLHEKFLGKLSLFLKRENFIAEYITSTSYDLFGPLRKRSWTEYCYEKFYPLIINNVNFPSKDFNVLLDFTPIAKIAYRELGSYYVWYDLIDNFAKHNRYSTEEKRKVKEKYDLVNDNADLITGVTPASLESFTNTNTLALSNGVFKRKRHQPIAKDAYTFGFAGFISDKFDIETVRYLLSNPDYSLAIYGKVLDRKVYRRLRKIQTVKFFGEFSYKDLDSIMCNFNIGLIPYLAGKSHDESPIKMYEYLSAGKAVLTTCDYGIKSDRVANINRLTESALDLFIRKHLRMQTDFAQENTLSLGSEHLWETKINDVITNIMHHSTKTPDG